MGGQRSGVPSGAQQARLCDRRRPPYPGRFTDDQSHPGRDRRLVTPLPHRPGLRSPGMHDHRATGGIATLPVLDDPAVGQHETRVMTGSYHDSKTTGPARGPGMEGRCGELPRPADEPPLSSLIMIAMFVLAACGSGASSEHPGSAAPPHQRQLGLGAVHGAQRRRAGRPERHGRGRVDTLPSSFPAIPGARPFEEAATGPASATLVIAGDVARLVAAALVTQSQVRGFRPRGWGRLSRMAVTHSMPRVRPGCKLH